LLDENVMKAASKRIISIEREVALSDSRGDIMRTIMRRLQPEGGEKRD
jgi:hypothetical protein